MQAGSVVRYRRGWRGSGLRAAAAATATFARKGDTLGRRFDRELGRIALGDRYRPPITLQQLADRFLAQPPASEQTITYARRRLVRPLAPLGDAQAADVTTEALQRIVTAVPGNSYRRDITRTLRMVYR